MHIFEDVHNPNPKLKLHYGDLTDGSRISKLIKLNQMKYIILAPKVTLEYLLTNQYTPLKLLEWVL